MAKVYKFRVEVEEAEKYLWREIEVTSGRSVAHLGYTVMTAFEGLAMHLFNIQYKDKHYEIDFEDFMSFSNNKRKLVDPVLTKLEKLNLELGINFR